ncbi:PAS domain S-box-containing protein [Cnuella takakiae]|uniref:histidine kinase n=1 Tax=Cnuella takakiae TaxID=1302690 RepID=A0A1M5CF04_9BACT|nr:ATP-binding protein [Cnuella takakiae]OLY91794.1 hypothetical protein BUE76_07695 [Cnuella takakiae]SHF53270.1 PAS domain S-box-containing protein [Cnuella takakiae]
MIQEPSTEFQIPEPYYTNLFEALPGSCILLQTDAPRYTILATTPEYLVQTGRTKEQLIGKGMFEAFPPNSANPADTGGNDVSASFDLVRLQKEPHQLPIQRYDVTDSDGQLAETYWSAVNKPVFSAEGEVIYIVHTAENITDLLKSERREEEHQALQQAHKKIIESEAKYRSLFQSMDQGYCLIEMIFDENNNPVDYRFIEINAVFEQQTGLQNALGKTARELIPNLEPHWFKLYGDVARTGQSIRFEEGSEAMNRWFDVFVYPLAGKESRRVMLLFRDVTEQKKAEAALKLSAQNLRNTIIQAPFAMCIFRGADFVIEVANDSMFEFWGKKAEDVMNKPLFIGIPEAKSQGYEELMTTVMQTGVPFSAKELKVTLPREGIVQDVYINFSYTPLREGDGQISGILAVAIDVTEQVLAHQKIEEVVAERTAELAKTNKELKRSNQNLEEFAHAASHDLKEPVRKIHFFTQQLREQLASRLNENEVRTFSRVENATQRMGNLIDDLLLYSHVSQRPHEREKVDLNEKVQRVLEDLDLDIEEKGAKIIVGKLPVVIGYRRQLQQLLQNLISNAIKYSKVDELPIIEILAEEVEKDSKAYHLIAVKDNGIGFASEYSEKIFQMFTRLHGKAEYSGTGVGLSIVKKVVENHDGLIEVESQPGVGSAFKIYLPA